MFRRITKKDLQKQCRKLAGDLNDAENKIFSLQKDVELLGKPVVEDVLLRLNRVSTELKTVNKPYSELEELLSELEFKVNRLDLSEDVLKEILQIKKDAEHFRKRFSRSPKRFKGTKKRNYTQELLNERRTGRNDHGSCCQNNMGS